MSGTQTLCIHHRPLRCFAFRRSSQKSRCCSSSCIILSTECSDGHLNSVAFYEAHYSQVSVVHGQQKNTNPFSELHSRSPSLRFLPLLKPPVPLGAANVSDIDPSSDTRLLLAPALHQKLRRYSSLPLSKVAQQFASAQEPVHE